MLSRTAILTVDLHRGHLDPAVATLPVPEAVGASVLEHASLLVTTAREAGYRIIHVTTEYGDADEIARNPNVKATATGPREGMPAHNLAGTRGVELMPEIYEDEDLVANPKKGFSPFLTTDLAYLLGAHDIERLVIAGVNTNTCIQCTCFELYNRGFEDIVVEECVGSMYGSELHEWGLRNIDQALGRVVSLDEAFDLLGLAS